MLGQKHSIRFKTLTRDCKFRSWTAYEYVVLGADTEGAVKRPINKSNRDLATLLKGRRRWVHSKSETKIWSYTVMVICRRNHKIILEKEAHEYILIRKSLYRSTCSVANTYNLQSLNCASTFVLIELKLNYWFFEIPPPQKKKINITKLNNYGRRDLYFHVLLIRSS